MKPADRFYRTLLSLSLVLLLSALGNIADAQGLCPSVASGSTTTACNPLGQNCGEPTESTEYPGGTLPDGTSYAAGTRSFAPGSVINVNINATSLYGGSEVTQAQIIAAITQAFTAWSGTSGVTFNVTTSNGDVSGPGTFNVSYGNITNGAIAGTTPDIPSDPAAPGYGSVIGATTVINSAKIWSCLSCYTIAMVHEIGHQFGLADAVINSGAAMDNFCGGTNAYPSGCGSVAPTQTDIIAAACENNDAENDCNSPSENGFVTNSTACQCGSGTSGDCSGGLVCGADGTCGCTSACDDPSCAGWTQSCGTCRDDGDCAGGLTCSNGQCGCSDPCDDASCPGYNTSCGMGGGCTTDNDCPGGLVCQSGTCGCSNICDDPSCDPNYAQDCEGGGGGGGCYDICDPGCVDYNGCGGGCTCEEGCNPDSLPVAPVSDGEPSPAPTSPSTAKKESVHPLCE